MFSLSSTAAIIPNFLDVTESTTGVGFTYTYEVTLTEDSRLDSNSRWAHFFTIFDFAGYIEGTAATDNPNFVLSTQNEGLYNSQGAPIEQDGDDVGIVNLSWTWQPCPPDEFCEITDPPAFEILGPISLGIFSADSMFSDTKLDAFQGQDTKHNPGEIEDGQRGINEGATTVPVGVLIPEPGTYALLGAGLLLFGVARKRMFRA
jgi:hypothetical protein